jgi:hypothetical protein
MRDFTYGSITAACVLVSAACWSYILSNRDKHPTCQSEFNQQVKSTSIEHGQDIPHKGKRPNRIVIKCEGK